MRDRFMFCLCGAAAGFYAVVVWASLHQGASPTRPILDASIWLIGAIWFATEIDARSAQKGQP